jgi:hypothetical protein
MPPQFLHMLLYDLLVRITESFFDMGGLVTSDTYTGLLASFKSGMASDSISSPSPPAAYAF